MKLRALSSAVLCFLLGISFAPAPSYADAPQLPPECRSLPYEKIVRWTKQGLTYFRICLIAGDEEWKQVKHAVEEAEHAVEHPADAEGFWEKKGELLRHPKGAFDLRRSFENVRRLIRLSKDFDSPIIRDFLMSAAVMFGITHGSEFALGVIHGTTSLIQLAVTWEPERFAAALAWYGLALPGLYDFGCWIGQGILVVRPTRYAFTQGRKWIALGVGPLGKRLSFNALFSSRSARERILAAAAENPSKTFALDLFVPNEDGIEVDVRASDDAVVAKLTFAQRGNEAILEKAVLDTATLISLDRVEFLNTIRGLGWNVSGALRQIRNLLERNQAHLIEKEKTFISSIETNAEGKMTIYFRKNAAWTPPEHRLKHPKHWLGTCQTSLASNTTTIQ